jgi:hypothetical protein
MTHIIRSRERADLGSKRLVGCFDLLGQIAVSHILTRFPVSRGQCYSMQDECRQRVIAHLAELGLGGILADVFKVEQHQVKRGDQILVRPSCISTPARGCGK